MIVFNRQGYGRTGWAYAHQNNQIKDGLTFVGDTAVSIKHNKTDTRTEHSHAKDLGNIEELAPVIDQNVEERKKQEQFAFGKKFSAATALTIEVFSAKFCEGMIPADIDAGLEHCIPYLVKRSGDDKAPIRDNAFKTFTTLLNQKRQEHS